MNQQGANQPEVAPPAEGLSTVEARRRLLEFGPNDIGYRHGVHALWELLLLLANPLALVLLGAAAVAAVVGDAVGAGIIIGIVLIGAAINATQTFRSARTMKRLSEQVALTSTVLRDGEWREVPLRDVVPGDLVHLGAGDVVPADCRLSSARDLHVNQAALTGESLPAEKEAIPGRVDTSLRPADPSSVFRGTSVISGTATAVVLATGRATMFGELVARLGERPPETEFDRSIRRFGLFIMQTVIALILVVFLVNATRHRAALESLLFAVALAVGLTPEFLPMIMGVTLARGAALMARRKVVVKHLAAIQNLGSMDFLCSDKTGTLTLGQMDVVAATDPFGRPADRALFLAYLNSSHETGIRSPLDAAILRHRQFDIAAYRKLDEVPFDFERRRLSVVVTGPEGALLITKGAPESLLVCCTDHESDGKAAPLDEDARRRFLAVVEQFGRSGQRLLAVACRSVSGHEPVRAGDETGLRLVGLIAFQDPPRADAGEAIRSLRRDGVRVCVLTGDNEFVARHVCNQVGLTEGALVTGEEVDRMSDAALGHVAESALAFARMAPAQKNRVIRALKSRGHVVGYLGDGVNDAPSLHAADIGISVAGAVDVAKQVAEVILLEPGLDVLHRGVREGRQAFGNVMKYLLMGTSSNFGNMVSMAAATAVLPFLPMLPLQILLNSFLYDLAQLTIPMDRVDRGFMHKPRRWEIGLIRRFMLTIGPLSTVFDFMTFWVLLKVFHAGEELFHTGWFVESLATQTLVLFVIRTAGNALRSRPSRMLTASVLGVAVVGVLLPYTPLAEPLGFVPLPAEYLLFVAVATASYLALVELVKRRLMRGMLR